MPNEIDIAGLRVRNNETRGLGQLTCETLLDEIERLREEVDHGRGKATPQEIAALTAALALQKPEEGPGFTVTDDEAKWLKEQIRTTHYYRSDQDKADAFLPKLDAYLESLA